MTFYSVLRYGQISLVLLQFRVTKNTTVPKLSLTHALSLTPALFYSMPKQAIEAYWSYHIKLKRYET